MGELHASQPWEVVSIDFLTSLPSTARGNKHLLVCCDHFTRWVEVFPLPDMKATTVAQVLTHELFSRFGCPQKLHSDCAANFRGELISEVCRLMGVQKNSTTSFHPQGNSRCERMMRTILGMLSKYLDDNHSEWDQHIPLLMLGYRSQVHKSLGYSPFFLMLGREPRLPVDVQIDAAPVLKSTSVASYVDKLCAGLRNAYREAIRMSHASNTRNKNIYERKLNTFSYKAGDNVSLFKNVPKKGEYYKFVRPWKPAVIVSVHGELNYSVRLEGSGKILRVHHNRLKPRLCSDQATAPVSSVEGEVGWSGPLCGRERAGLPGRPSSGRQNRTSPTCDPILSADDNQSASADSIEMLRSAGAGADPGVETRRGAGADPGVETPRGAGADPGVETPWGAGADPGVETPRGAGAKPGVETPRGAGADPGVVTPRGAGAEPGVETPRGAGDDPGVETPRGAGAKPGVETPRGAGADPGVVTPRGAGAEPGVETPRGAGAEPGVETSRGTGAEPGVGTPRGAGADPGVGTPRGAGADPGVVTPRGAGAESDRTVPTADGSIEGPRRSNRVKRNPAWFTFSVVLLLWVLFG